MMKTHMQLKGMLLMFAMVLLGSSAFAWNGVEDEVPDTINFKVFYGKVINNENGRILPFANIEAVGSNVATVSNIDGDFSIKLSRDSKVSELKITYVGFNNTTVSLDEFKADRYLTIGLSPSPVQLQEVTIRPQAAMELVMQALANVRKNYPIEPMMMRGFYRETIHRNRNYVSISEAVIDTYKSAYGNDFQFDQIKLFKGRKSADVEKMDTVLFKVQGGPSTTILLDLVKNPNVMLTNDFMEIYDFEVEDLISIDDRLHYVVGFKQKSHVSDPFYLGKLYIDMEKLAISEAEFELNTDNKEEAARMFIQRKPMGMTIIPERAVYRVKYTIEDNRWYFAYARAEVRFKVNWKKKLFNTNYTTMSELAITDRTYEGIEKFANKERFKSYDILNDKVYIFFDQDFWAGYNVIEPDQSIESAIRKLNRKYLRRQ